MPEKVGFIDKHLFLEHIISAEQSDELAIREVPDVLYKSPKDHVYDILVDSWKYRDIKLYRLSGKKLQSAVSKNTKINLTQIEPTLHGTEVRDYITQLAEQYAEISRQFNADRP